MRAAREDLEVVELRGNVDTRLRKLADRRGPATRSCWRAPGSQRLGREHEAGGEPRPGFVPARRAGALALEARAGDEPAAAPLARSPTPTALACLLAERALARALGADCNTPVGACARPAGERELQLRAWVGLPDGSAG